MDLKNVEKKLREKTPSEKKYQNNITRSKEYYDNLEKRILNHQSVYIFDDLIPAGQNFNVVKHTRFIDVPLHIHNFIELNYIYSGTCKQIIDGKEVILKKGEICLIDTAVPHSIDFTTEDDLIINILVRREYFIKQLGQEVFNASIVYDFMLNALSESQNHDQYIVFKNSNISQIDLIIKQILNEYYNDDIGSTKIIENLISILFTLLVRNFEYDTNKKEVKSKHGLIEILQYIDQNFLTVDLETLSRKFNYNNSYLSYFLKKETNKNFSQIVTEKKLNYAEMLLVNSNKSIQECSIESGFSNITFFYKKYKEHFGKMPSDSRNNK